MSNVEGTHRIQFKGGTMLSAEPVSGRLRRESVSLFQTAKRVRGIGLKWLPLARLIEKVALELHAKACYAELEERDK
jgi:hypothetical protein